MSDIETRLRRLEQGQDEIRRELSELRASLAGRSGAAEPIAEPPRRPPAQPLVAQPGPGRVAPSRVPTQRLTIEDLATPRNLAVAGGVAVTVGIAFLVSYGISRGWITEEIRVIAAAIFSLALTIAGAYLIERDRRAAPAMAMTQAGLVGLFLTVLAATRLYELMSTELGIALATLVGALATAAALRWSSEATATLAVSGALLSPLLVGAEYSPGILAFLAPLFAISMALTAVQRWPVLFSASFALMIASVLAVDPPNEFTAWGALGVAGAGVLLAAIGALGRSLLDGVELGWQAPLYGLIAVLLGALGYAMIDEALVAKGGDPDLPATLASVWLFGVAGLNGLLALRLSALGAADTRRAALTVGVAALAWGLGEVFDGPALVISWSAAATVTLIAARHDWERTLGLGLAGLAAAHTVIFEIPPDALVDGVAALGDAWIATLSLIVVAASTWVWATPERQRIGLAIAAGLLIYAVSVTIVDVSQLGPQPGGHDPSAFDSEARGQALVSSLWALCGLGLVVGGLRRARPAWRSAGLVLLGLAAAKIVLYDLAALSTAARTVSFIVVGLVFLVAAFAYQALASRLDDPSE